MSWDHREFIVARTEVLLSGIMKTKLSVLFSRTESHTPRRE